MQWLNSPQRYGAIARAFHWGMLALLAAVCLAIELKGVFPRGSAGRTALLHWHELLGLTAALAVFSRLAWRAFDAPPAALPGPDWQRRAASAVKLALYVLLIALPLTGLVAAAGRGDSTVYFGVDLVSVIGPVSKALGKAVEDVHEALATAAYWLVGLHAAAALWHHFVLRDATLRRMLPVRC